MRETPDEVIQDPPFRSGDLVPARFICQIIAHQISAASRSRGRLLHPGDEPAFSGLWSSYYRYLLAHLRIANQCIRGEKYRGKTRAFHCLYSLLRIDLEMRESSWQAHIKGGLAYAQHLGGPKVALSMAEPSLFFRQIVV